MLIRINRFRDIHLRLVDDPEHNQTGNGTSILRRLTLCVVEVGGYRDNGMGDLLSKVGFSNFLQPLMTFLIDLKILYI